MADMRLLLTPSPEQRVHLNSLQILQVGDMKPDLEGHAVGQQHGVAVVDGHAVLAHGVLDFPHDAGSRGLDAQAAGGLQHVVGGGFCADDPLGTHDRPQICTLHQQLIPGQYNCFK